MNGLESQVQMAESKAESLSERGKFWPTSRFISSRSGLKFSGTAAHADRSLWYKSLDVLVQLHLDASCNCQHKYHIFDVLFHFTLQSYNLCCLWLGDAGTKYDATPTHIT